MTKAGVRACVRVCVSSAFSFICFVVCLCSQPSSMLTLGANFKGDRILFFFLLRTVSHAAAPASRFVVRTDKDALFTSSYTSTLSSFLFAFLHV